MRRAPQWLERGLRFWEDDDDAEEGSEEESREAEDEEEGEEEEAEDEESEEDDSKKKKTPTEAQRLKDELARSQSALKKERLARRKAERDARAARKGLSPKTPPGKKGAGKKEQEDDEEATAAAERTAVEARVTRLAERFRESAVDNLIIRLAPKFNFADPEDAISLVNRKEIEVDQDDEDPADVEIDEDTVKTALKRLAKRKPHLLKAPQNGEVEEEEDGEEDDDEPRPRKRTTGSKFSGKSKRKSPLSEEMLRKRYPALGPKRS